MSQNDTLDYEAMGIRWDSEAVAQVYGDNQSDKRIVNNAAQIAVMVDVQKFEAAFPGYILSMSDGTSLRVACQRIGRKFGGKDIEKNREAVLAHLRGVRTRTSPTTVRRNLPDGTFYTGTNETEYRAQYMALLVDAGCPGDVAQNIARGLSW